MTPQTPTQPSAFTIPVRTGVRGRRLVQGFTTAALVVSLGLAGCSTGTETLSVAESTSVQVEEFGDWPTDAGSDSPAPAQQESEFLPVGPPDSALPGATAPPPASTRLGSALDNLDRLANQAAPYPVGLSIGSIDVLSASVNPVGVTDTGEMEIPGPDEVGWYQYGASPGEPGSAVLAAHIAYDGVDGVFRELTELEPGARLWVEYSDGSYREFRVEALRQYDKDELPKDELFARDGEPILALITCGGDFQPNLRSYEDNIVALAVPV